MADTSEILDAYYLGDIETVRTFLENEGHEAFLEVYKDNHEVDYCPCDIYNEDGGFLCPTEETHQQFLDRLFNMYKFMIESGFVPLFSVDGCCGENIRCDYRPYKILLELGYTFSERGEEMEGCYDEDFKEQMDGFLDLGCPWSMELFKLSYGASKGLFCAKSKDRIKVCEYFVEKGCILSNPNLSYLPADIGDLEMIKMLDESGCDFDSNTYHYAKGYFKRTGNNELINYLDGIGCR